MAAPFRFDRRWVFAVPPADLWATLQRTDRFTEWWQWLRQCDADGLAEGSTASCLVRAPVPYSLSFTVTVLELAPERLIDTRVAGDLEGPARLDMAPHPDGSEVRLSWEIELRAALLRSTSRVARPLMEWGHDWVIRTGVEQFRRRALDEGGR